MTKKEIRKRIRELKQQREEIRDKALISKDVQEVRDFEIELKGIVKEIEKLKDDLEDISDEEKKAEEEERANMPVSANAHVPANAKKVGFDRKAVLGSFSTRGSLSADNSIYIKRDQSFMDKVSEPKKLDLGKYVRGAVTGAWDNATEERSVFTTGALGVVIPEVLSAQIIDFARNKSLFALANVPMVPMETNNLTIARVASDPVFSFKQEGAAQSAGNTFEMDSINLQSKTCYGYASVSLETLHSAQNLNEIMLNVFSSAMADAIDKGFLYGQNGDTFAPSGIMNDTDINSIVASNQYYNDFIKAIGKIRRYNGEPSVIGMNASTDEYISLLHDSNYNVLTEPKVYADMQKIITNQLKEEDTGSDAIVFDPNAMLIGVQKYLMFEILNSSDSNIKEGTVTFRIYSMVDCKATQPKHICKITGINPATGD